MRHVGYQGGVAKATICETNAKCARRRNRKTRLPTLTIQNNGVCTFAHGCGLRKGNERLRVALCFVFSRNGSGSPMSGLCLPHAANGAS